MLKKQREKLNETLNSININKLIYASIFVILAGFIINGCFLKISEHISEYAYRFVDIFLLLIESLIIGFTLLILLLKKTKRIITIYGIFIGTFIISYLVFPQNKEAILSVTRNFFLFNVTSFVLFLEASKDKDLFRKIVKISKVVFIFSVIYLIILMVNNELIYNVWLSRHFFLASIFTLYDFYKNKTKTSLFVTVFSFIALTMTGSRTYLIFYLLLIGMLFLVFIVNYIKKASLKKRILTITLIVVLLIVSIIVLINFEEICRNLYIFFYQNNIDIRILELLSTGDFFTSDDRTDIIYPAISNLIRNNWLIGTGIGGDRVEIYNIFSELNKLGDGYNISAYYAHNIILELYADFGVIIATAMIAFIIYCYYNVAKNRKWNLNIVICLSWISILPSMLNGTLLDNTYLWALLGVLIASLFKETNIEEYDNKESKKVIMLLDNAFEPDIRVYKEAKYLVENNIDVEIVCLDKKNEYIDKEVDNFEGIKIKRIFSRTDKTTRLIEKVKIISKLKKIIYFWWLIKFIYKTKKYLYNKDFEILHCHDLVMGLIGCMFFDNKQIVFDMHEYYGNSKNKVVNFFIKKLVSYVQDKSKWIIYVNENQKKNCKKRNIEKFIEIPNYPEKRSYEKSDKTYSDKIRISYIGKVRDYYSLSKLIDCATKFDSININIYGNGSEYERLLKYAESKGNKDIMKGYFSALENASELYNNTDILYAVYDTNGIDSENWKNSMPIKSFEAIITATPIIASKNTVLGEFVEKNNIGFTIDIRKEGEFEVLIERIIKNKNLLKEKIDNIKKIQYMYTWDNVIKNIDKIYLNRK